MLTALVKALLVVLFVLLGLNAGIARRDGVARQRRINVFIIYSIMLIFGAGLTQREVWPFTTWPLVSGIVPPKVDNPRFLAVDAQGGEHEIDYRAWAPLEFAEFIGWEEKNFFLLPVAQRDRVAAYLLGVVETARVRWAAGNPDLRFERFLGPLSAPFFLGHPERWVPGSLVPDRPFVGLRLYRETWNVEQRARDPARVSRRLVYEYRTP